MKFSRLLQKYRNIALLTLSSKVVVYVLNNVLNEIIFESYKHRVASAHHTMLAYIVSMFMCMILNSVRDVSFIRSIIVTNSYRDIETVIPEGITRYTHIQCDIMDIIRS